MRPRYLLLIGPDDEGATAMGARLAALLPRRLSVGSLRLFVDEATRVMVLPRSEGFVIGTLFDRATGARVDQLSPGQDHAVTSTFGGLLIERHWGSYVAFWTDPARGVGLLRDPAGAVPALVDDLGPGAWVTSDPVLAIQASLFRPVIAWERLGEMLRYPTRPGQATMLDGLVDTIPGTCHTLGREPVADRCLWSPGTFAGTGLDLPAATHAERLRDAVDGAVASWRSCHDTVGLELSGGLDSSIVAAALAKTGRSWSGITFATAGADGDERCYARAVRDHFAAPLHEVEAVGATAEFEEGYRRLTPRPRGISFLGGVDRAMTEARDALGLSAVFSGLGGDHVFFATRSTAPVLDALAYAGPAAARSAAKDVARLCSVPLLEVYRKAARRAWTHRGARRAPPDTRYLAAGAPATAPSHPWLALPSGTPHGTRARIRKLLDVLGYLDGVDRLVERTTICPLLAQPVVETCLAIPSWLCVSQGRDRAVARDAFVGRLPDLVLRRRDKGHIGSLLVGRYERRRPLIRTLLLDGLLAGAGLLDRQALERDLARPGSMRDPFQDRLMELVDAELWARAVAAALPAAV